jgi:hypothetical protein
VVAPGWESPITDIMSSTAETPSRPSSRTSRSGASMIEACTALQADAVLTFSRRLGSSTPQSVALSS